VIFAHIGHQFGIGGCFDQIMADFVDRGATTGWTRHAATARSWCRRSK
jgi:hypothetical protein